jgi:hypothetical protein
MYSENRASIRISVSIPVKIFGVSGKGQAFSGEATVINLGKHGACLMTGQLVEPGQILLLETSEAGILDSEVVWTEPMARSTMRSVGIRRAGLAAAFGYSIPS